jgi:hypothetical protein
VSISTILAPPPSKALLPAIGFEEARARVGPLDTTFFIYAIRLPDYSGKDFQWGHSVEKIKTKPSSGAAPAQVAYHVVEEHDHSERILGPY